MLVTEDFPDWEHSGLILATLPQLYNEEMYADVSFHCCNGKIVKAHRIVLSCLSPFLQELFTEQKFRDTVDISLPDVDSEDLDNFLRFVYEGLIRLNEKETILFQQMKEMLGIDFPIVVVCDDGNEIVENDVPAEKRFGKRKRDSPTLSSPLRKKSKPEREVLVSSLNNIISKLSTSPKSKQHQNVIAESAANNEKAPVIVRIDQFQAATRILERKRAEEMYESIADKVLRQKIEEYKEKKKLRKSKDRAKRSKAENKSVPQTSVPSSSVKKTLPSAQRKSSSGDSTAVTKPTAVGAVIESSRLEVTPTDGRLITGQTVKQPSSETTASSTRLTGVGPAYHTPTSVLVANEIQNTPVGSLFQPSRTADIRPESIFCPTANTLCAPANRAVNQPAESVGNLKSIAPVLQPSRLEVIRTAQRKSSSGDSTAVTKPTAVGAVIESSRLEVTPTDGRLITGQTVKQPSSETAASSTRLTGVGPAYHTPTSVLAANEIQNTLVGSLFQPSRTADIRPESIFCPPANTLCAPANRAVNQPAESVGNLKSIAPVLQPSRLEVIRTYSTFALRPAMQSSSCLVTATATRPTTVGPVIQPTPTTVSSAVAPIPIRQPPGTATGTSAVTPTALRPLAVVSVSQPPGTATGTSAVTPTALRPLAVVSVSQPPGTATGTSAVTPTAGRPLAVVSVSQPPGTATATGSVIQPTTSALTPTAIRPIAVVPASQLPGTATTERRGNPPLNPGTVYRIYALNPTSQDTATGSGQIAVETPLNISVTGKTAAVPVSKHPTNAPLHCNTLFAVPVPQPARNVETVQAIQPRPGNQSQTTKEILSNQKAVLFSQGLQRERLKQFQNLNQRDYKKLKNNSELRFPNMTRYQTTLTSSDPINRKVKDTGLKNLNPQSKTALSTSDLQTDSQLELRIFNAQSNSTLPISNTTNPNVPVSSAAQTSNLTPVVTVVQKSPNL